MLALLCLPAAACILDTKNGGEVQETLGDGSNDAESGEDDGGPALDECTGAADCDDPTHVCAFGTCQPPAAGCSANAPICGNGIVEAFEECEGDIACNECVKLDQASMPKQGSLSVTAVAEIPGGRFAAVGRLASDPQTVSVAVMNSDLDEVAITTLGSSIAIPMDIAAGPNDTILVAGVGSAPIGQDGPIAVVALDDTLTELWTVPDLGVGEVGDVVSINADATRIVVGGMASWSSGNVLAWLDATGSVLQTAPPPLATGDVAVNAVLIPGGTAGLVVDLSTDTGLPDTALVLWDDAGQATLTTDLGDAGAATIVEHIAAAPDGSVWVAGFTDGESFLAQYDEQLVELGRVQCLGGAGASITALDVSAAGDVGLAIAGALDHDATWYATVSSSGQLYAGWHAGPPAAPPGTLPTTSGRAYLWTTNGTPLVVYDAADGEASIWRDLWTPA